MAYQVISQNNTTTTLADENGNIIHVPARVSLATSTDYTITKVNNTTATLEDGNGNIIRDVPCVAVLYGGDGGGGDQHNLGWYATPEALRTAHPTANDGDWAIVGSTDTVWVWDSDTTAWKDTDQKGQVESVNGQTGTVVLTASDVGAATAAQGGKADTAVQPGDLATVATTGAYSDLSGTPTIPAPTQVSTLPTAGADELGNIYQFVGTTDANYTNGYFYKCVSDGQNPATYSWVQTDVQPAGGGSSYTAGTGIDITSGVISVTSPTLQNTATGTNAITIGGTASNKQEAVNIGVGSQAKENGSVAIGYAAHATGNYSTAIGDGVTATGTSSLAICGSATANSAIQLGGGTNSVANTFKVGNANGNFEIMSADGTIPTARLTKVNTTITLAAADWSSNTQTVSVTGMTATGVVMVSPDPADQSAYTAAGVLCTAQAAGTLTFTCDTVPSGDLSVNVVML